MYLKMISHLFIVFLFLVSLQSIASDHKGTSYCLQMITYAKNEATGEIKAFPTSCDVPPGWKTLPPIGIGGGKICSDVIAYAKDPKTGKIKAFPTPCDVPPGWISIPDIEIGDGKICPQVITYAKNPETKEIKAFPTPCDVPPGWIIIPDISTLSSFLIVSQAQGSFKLKWKTVSERDNAGFFIWRATKDRNGYQDVHKINQLIPAEGNLIGEASYSYQDIITDFNDELVYCYGLEDLDIHGMSTYHYDFIRCSDE